MSIKNKHTFCPRSLLDKTMTDLPQFRKKSDGLIFKCLSCQKKRAVDSFICDPCLSKLIRRSSK